MLYRKVQQTGDSLFILGILFDTITDLALLAGPCLKVRRPNRIYRKMEIAFEAAVKVGGSAPLRSGAWVYSTEGQNLGIRSVYFWGDGRAETFKD